MILDSDGLRSCAREQSKGGIITVYVNDVVDGDNFQTFEGYKIRLAAIDAPKNNETGYLEFTEYLE